MTTMERQTTSHTHNNIHIHINAYNINTANMWTRG